jgi:hypothetical protein
MKILTDPDEYFRLKEWAEKTIQELGISGAEKLREATDKTIKESKAPNSRMGKIDIEKLEDVSFSLTRALNDRKFNTFMDDRLKRRDKERSSKGGQRKKKEPGFNLLVEYAWNHSKRKTHLSMWQFLKSKLKDVEAKSEKIGEYDFIYETKPNKITLYLPNGKSRDMGFRSFQRYVKDFKEGLKNNSQ